MQKRIAIIGGGAAGIMCAATLLEKNTDAEIHLFEKNPSLGKKVIISGGGRCNVTTGITETHVLDKKYIRGIKFLKPAMANFPPQKVYSWFEAHGVPLKNEEDNRVFPVSDQGTDIVAVFEKLFKDKNVHLHFNEAVSSIKKVDEAFELISYHHAYPFDFVVLTTGGNAYRHTGSTGDGYDFAKSCGHSITTLGPSLNSFEVDENWPKELSGLSFPNARLETTINAEKVNVSGPFLFTHFGISGPLTFAFSAHTAFETVSREQPLKINFAPHAEVSFEQWNNRLQALFIKHGAKQVGNVIAELFPKRFVEQLVLLAAIPYEQQAAIINKEERKKLAHLLSGNIMLSLIARRAGDEFVTAGGVNTDEIDRKTMESKICPRLYLAGEVMNVDGVTGGFNLQVAWCTGKLAGENIAKELQKEKIDE